MGSNNTNHPLARKTSGLMDRLPTLVDQRFT